MYSLHAKTVQGSKGQSVVAKSTYNARSVSFDKKTGKRRDYRYKGSVLFSELMFPTNAPEWITKLCQNRPEFWEDVEVNEKRKDAQYAREVVVALPHVLTVQQCIDLTKEFVQENFIHEGMVADVTIHPPPPGGDNRNIHAHILLTMREITIDGYGNKVRTWNSKKFLMKWRRQWAMIVNRDLELYGHKERIDYRSLKEQGIDREPTVHLGAKATRLERSGISTGRGDKNREISARNRLCKQSGNHQGIKQRLIDLAVIALQRSNNEPFILVEKLTDDKKFWDQQLRDIERKIAVDNIRRDMIIGHDPSVQDFYKLSRNDLANIKKYGREYLENIFHQKERQRSIEMDR